MSVLLKRGPGLETFQTEPYEDVDGEGKPSYGAPQSFRGRAADEVEEFTGGSGQSETTTLSVWVDAGATVVPDELARITRRDVQYVVRKKQTRRRLNGKVDHYKLLCREE